VMAYTGGDRIVGPLYRIHPWEILVAV